MHQELNRQDQELEQSSLTTWWSKIHLIALVGFLLRLIQVGLSDQIHQSDEIFQYLEQAHRLEFGYGVIPWEYRYGIRSWVLPGLLAGPLHILHALHIEDPNVYIPLIKILFCALSISIIYASYVIGRNIASENAGKLASLFACFWYELVYFASKPTPEVLGTYCLVIAIACTVVQPNTRNAVLFGFFTALSVILRFQYLPVVFILAIVYTTKHKKKQLLISSFVFLLLVVIAGYADYLTWGGFFISYYNNYLYNSVYKVSEVFGTNSSTYLFNSLIYNSAGLFFVVGLVSFRPAIWPKTWLLMLCILGIIVPHSLIAHKEYRFIFAAVPCFILLLGINLSSLLVYCQRWQPVWKRNVLYALIAVVGCLSISGLLVKLPSQDVIYSQRLINRQPILSAYLFLYRQPDLSAVFNAYIEWYQTGGYYYLHRNIPVYYPDHFQKIQDDDYKLYASHLICHKNYKPISGFVTIFQIGDLEIRKVVNSSEHYQKLDIDTMNIPQIGVDDRFKPTVKSYL